ncbi:MAG TPA: secretin N-terminal domain-containing protein [Chthoniobacteraceae bacterium]|nr:secretin N-terminal domain-containing protein [Chthoniobacteraceae bacterium]
MAKLHSSLLAFGAISLASAIAQDNAAPATPPVIPPVAPAPTGPAVGGPVSPSPIEPPIAIPNAPAVPPAPASNVSDSALVAPGSQGSNAARLNEFQGDEIGLVLRTLARQGNMNVVVSDKVATAAGTVTMRLENKTAREAIEVIVQDKGLFMSEINGVWFIKTQEEKAKEPTESASYTLSYASAKDILPLLQGQLQSGLAPQFDQRTNTVFYREAKSNLEKILIFLESIDKPTTQVMIEARLVEVNANPRQSYGINWAGVVGSSSVAKVVKFGASPIPDDGKYEFTTNPDGSIVLNDTLVGGNGFPLYNALPRETLGADLAKYAAAQYSILSIPQMAATVRLLNEDQDTEFLANPRIVTANNQKAEIKITRAQPVPQLNFNEQTAQAVFSGFQDKEFGNTLTVTPIINKDDYITLNVKPEISNKVADATFTFSGSVVTSPIIDKRVLESNVLIKSGDTLAIGGLLQDEQSKGSTKVPVLGDIPVIGYLFQEKLNSRNKRNLLVFVTPTIIKQGYGTGLENQVSGLTHSGEEYADPNGWRNNAKGAMRLVPTSHRSLAADVPKPGVPKAPKKLAK